MGLTAGAGALVLPRRIALRQPAAKFMASESMMTVAWYLLGGLAAAGAGRVCEDVSGAALHTRRRAARWAAA